jgi:hypothetical protein
MRCDEFESRLNEALDARRDPGDDLLLSGHARHCRSCRDLAVAMELIGESLRWAECPEPDEGLTEKVLACVAATPSLQSSRPWSVWTHVTLAAAVALLVMLVLPRRENQEASHPSLAAVAPQVELAQLEFLPAAQPVGQLARDATARYATLARNTSESLSGVFSLWQPATPEPQASNEAPPPREPLLAEMAAGLRPLADSTTGAVRFLLDVLPQGEGEGSRQRGAGRGQQAEGS